MATVTITYNSSTGSDTAASGSGPATAITGTNATNGTGNVVNLDGSPDLSGVAVNDVIWISVSGATRNLSRITAVDNTLKTVTTEDTFTLTGNSWAIGGKRQTFINNTSNEDWKDWKSSWRVELDDGTYNDNGVGITPTDPGSEANGYLEIVASASATGRPTVQHTSGNYRTIYLTAGSERILLQGLTIHNSVDWVGASPIYSGGSSAIINVLGCEITTSATTNDPTAVYISGTSVVNFVGNYLHGGFGYGFEFSSGTRATGYIWGNWIDGVNNHGFYMLGPSSYAERSIQFNIISNVGGSGIYSVAEANTESPIIANNTIYNSTNDGINISGTLTNMTFNVRNNILVSNGGYGLNATSATIGAHVFANYNAFYSNTSGEINNATDQGNNITLTGDPFTASGSSDFTLNNTSGAGADCRGAAFPTSFGFGSMTNSMDLGALQAVITGGSGGGIKLAGAGGGLIG